MGKSEVAVFSWRHTYDKDPEIWKEWCRRWGKHWVFQREISATGYDHYQGYISLKERRTVQSAKAVISENDILPMHFEPVCDKSVKGGEAKFYACKEDTRKDGPWSDQDPVVFVPYQFQGILAKLKPFQRHIWESSDIRDARKIDVVVDRHGNAGKSTIAALMDIYGRGLDLPPINDSDKLIASVCDILLSKGCREPKVLFFDLTRSQNQDQLFGLYTAIEQCKKGKVFDLRYNYKEWWFHSPRIWVFCNAAPKREYLSEDRWRACTIIDGELKEENLH